LRKKSARVRAATAERRQATWLPENEQPLIAAPPVEKRTAAARTLRRPGVGASAA